MGTTAEKIQIPHEYLAEKPDTPYPDTHKPYKCRKCGSQGFARDVSGSFTTEEYVAPPTKDEDLEKWNPDDDAEIDMDDADYDIDRAQDWECNACHSKDIITVDEYIDKKDAFEKALNEGRILIVNPNQIDLFTGQPVGVASIRFLIQ